MSGGEWCVDVYRAKGRWRARAYRRSKHAKQRAFPVKPFILNIRLERTVPRKLRFRLT